MWFESRDSLPPPDASARWRMKQGQEVTEAARAVFADGEFVGGRPSPAQLEAGWPLFEATFTHSGFMARTDVLRPDGSGRWIMTEIKSSTMKQKKSRKKAKRDAAFQAMVLDRAGVDLAAVEIMHLNPDYVHPGAEPLFDTVRLGKEREALVKEARSNAPALRDLLQQDAPPEPGLSRQCTKCNCPESCAELPEHSVFTLPRLHWRNTDRLLDDGRVRLDEVEGHDRLKPRHERYIEAVRSGEPHVDLQGIQALLAGLEYPVHFFDFEAVDYAVPRFKGTSPWSKIPFQYSLHVLGADGTLTHYEYLHEYLHEQDEEANDPRPELLERMLAHIEPKGSVVVYHKPFEEKRLEELAKAFPTNSGALEGIIDRLWDQADIFMNWHYIHPRQKGSCSLKRVLPAIAPKLAYDDLAIQDGMAAVRQYDALTRATSASEKEVLREKLLAYCERDTYAMVAIHEALSHMT